MRAKRDGEMQVDLKFKERSGEEEQTEGGGNKVNVERRNEQMKDGGGQHTWPAAEIEMLFSFCLFCH